MTVMRAAMYSSMAVTPQSFEFIEYLLWAKEQTDLLEAKARRRWWAYMSKVKHPEDNESIEYGVPFVRLQSQPEPHEYLFYHRKRRPDGAMLLPHRSSRFPRHSPRFNGVRRV
ncbi:hypothetical protein VPH35_082044 [Triticum aestivum]